MSSKYTKDYEERKPCCSKGKYYSHNNLFRYARQNDILSQKHAGKCNDSADVEERYCGKNCQSPNATTYYTVPKTDCTCCKGKANKDCWVGVM